MSVAILAGAISFPKSSHIIIAMVYGMECSTSGVIVYVRECACWRFIYFLTPMMIGSAVHQGALQNF